MSSTNLYRLSGVAIIVGALLDIASQLMQQFIATPTVDQGAIAGWLAVIGTSVLLLGASGLLARVARAIGTVGLIGFVALYIGGAMQGVGGGMLDFVFPFLQQAAPKAVNGPPPATMMVYFNVGGIVQLIGCLLLGIALLRRSGLANWTRAAAALLLVGGLVNAVASLANLPGIIGLVAIVVFFIGFGMYGVALVSERRVEVAEEQ